MTHYLEIRFDLGLWQISKRFYRKLKYRENIFEEFEDLARFPRKMILYWSTNFCIWKPWAITSNLIRFHLWNWQPWKSFHRKLTCREKVFEEIQLLPRFSRKMIFYWSTNFRIWKTLPIISNVIRFDLGFWQASKPFYKKFKYRKKVLEEFQRLHHFPRKMVLYLLTTFRILKPWAIISNFVRFDLAFWQASKPFYWKLKYREKVLEEFQRLPCFPRKIVLHSSTNFHILNPWAIISNLIRFDLGFWQASKLLYRKLKYREKVLEGFQRLPRFPRKMVLYSSTSFWILKPWAIVSNLIRFDLRFWQASKSCYRKLKYR